ncbi:MAG TPA: GNAT family N-acetyltransferase [Candidatus Elarobacter sp.]|jgi:GNAT superfamily N-acetyltransferase
MYLDQLPDLAFARLVRARARGVAIRAGDRAVAVAFLGDGTLMPADTIVRFDVTRGEDATSRLTGALAATGAERVWFYGGDAMLRRAAVELDLALHPAGGVFVHRMDAAHTERVVFRPPSQRDLEALATQSAELELGFDAPYAEVAEIGGEPVGFALREPLDRTWTEVRVALHPAQRGKGYGGALLAALADRIEATGRRVCAATTAAAGPERAALEAAGFRLSDYYFRAMKR